MYTNACKKLMNLRAIKTTILLKDEIDVTYIKDEEWLRIN